MVHQIYIVFKASKIACYHFVNLFIDSTCNQSYFTIRTYDLSTVLSEIIRDIPPPLPPPQSIPIIIYHFSPPPLFFNLKFINISRIVESNAT